jgi:hypothetical protein
MRKWLTVAGVLMLLAWVPFLYGELTSSTPERKGRVLPADDPSQEPVTADEAAAGTEGAAKPLAAVPELAAEAPKQPAAKEAEAQPTKMAAEPSTKVEQPEPSAAEGEAQPDDEQADPPPPPPTAGGPTPVLKQAFDTEPRDPLWAADTEAHIKALFHGEDVPSELLQSTSCRKAVCRVELRWTRERATAYVSVYEAMHKEFGGELGVEPIGEPDDKGQEQVNLYLARKGYTVTDLAK